MSQMTFPISFNALTIPKTGEPVSLQRKTIESLKEDEALIRVAYASINKMDPLLARRNLFNLPEPYVLGFDFSGEVMAWGAGHKDGPVLTVGQPVFGNVKRGGCFAEYVVTPKELVLPRESVPAPEASTLGVAYMTAAESMVITGNIQRHKGKWIYVAGAAGGVGHFAAQIAKLYGLKVIGSAGKAASLDLLRRLELDHIIDYSKQDVVQEIMKLTGGKGADLVYDSTGSPSSYTQSAAVVASGGEYIRLGTAAQLAFSGSQDMTGVVEGRGAKMTIGDAGRYSTDPQYIAQRSKLNDVLKQAVVWYKEGKLKPVITATVPFDAAALQRALEDFVKGVNNVGKVVVKCS